MIATAAFDLDSWDPQSTEQDAPGAQFARIAIRKTFTGQIEGSSTVEMLTAVTGTSRAYVAFERLAVAVEGRKGTFVLHHSASGTELNLTVLTGSGTGELAGISGTAVITQDDAGAHTLALTYELG